jgi:hypothetical protein
MRHVYFRLRSQEGFEQKSPQKVLELYLSIYSTTMTQFKLSTHFLADARDLQYSTERR